ncbi:TerB family tellurite resistance protein [Streptomyces sp. SID4985]|uniref:TerB family tellurite resistance protein n=1 Tax=unclassified Streptomyces TaxID=2593676 RepID=UPI00136E42E2|nr:TerB family tellurite resistance protein [Streptomyces sp. SID4985]
MLPVRGRDGRAARAARILGTRTTWTPAGDGEFFCPGCGGDRNYQRMTGHVRLTLLGVPVLSRGETGPVVECAACQRHYGLDALDHPTSRRLSAMLRDAVHTVALAVLVAGGTASRAPVAKAAATVRAGGVEDCAEEELAALADAAGPYGAGLALELHTTLDPLAPHLAAPGREALFLDAARIALADGPYTPAEQGALAAIGAALLLGAGETGRLLEVARRRF